MKVHLLIQRTFSGLNTEYTTSPAIAKLDTKLFLTDERNMAMQLTDAPFFSLAKNEQWVAYSFIKKVLDREKRAGFYAIRLFLSPRYQLTNVRECLITIAKRYEATIQAGVAQQEYSDLLTQIEARAIKERAPYTIDETSIKKGDYYTVATPDSLESLFEDDRNAFIEKLYLFTEAINSPHLGQFHLQPIENINTRRLQIEDTRHYLKSLWVNEVAVPATTKLLLLPNDAKVYYQFPNNERQLLPNEATHLSTKALHIIDSERCIESVEVRNQPVKPKTDFYIYGFQEDTFTIKLKGRAERIEVADTLSELRTRKLLVKNPDDYLAKFWVNEVEIPIGKKAEVCALQTDSLSYSIRGKAAERKAVTLYEDTLLIQLPQQGNSSTASDKSNWEDLLLFAVLALIIGGVGGYAFRNYTYKEELQQKQQQLDDTNALLEKENQKLFSLPTK